MIIRRILKKYNSTTKRREDFLEDREFHSFQEIKDYCIESMIKKSLYDNVEFKFLVMDTNEEIEITASWIQDDDDCYVKLSYSL